MRDEARARCQTLAGFVREAWHVLEPVAKYVHSWHIDAMCQHLEAVSDGRINRLLINVPPGSSKSLLVSVLWPAWEWGPKRKPSMRYLTTSFNGDAVKRDNQKSLNLILSEWYQNLWPEVQLVTTGVTSYSNTATGTRVGASFGSLTSKRGDRLIIDDPHSIKTAESETQRNETTRDFREGAVNRLNDQHKSAIVVIMQRLHENDISGVILSLKMGYVHLRLPMEFEADNRCHTSIGFSDPRKREGELLDPIRFPQPVLSAILRDMGSHGYAGQYQQRPSAREGGMFKRHWFTVVDAIPAEAVRKVRRWDLAASVVKPGTNPDWTVGLKMSTHAGKFYVEDIVRFRESGATVRRAIKATASLDGRPCAIVVPEDPGQAGKDQAASIIGENAGYKISAVRETGDKATRAEPLAAQAEAGNLCILKADWNSIFVDEMCGFPGGHDDMFDTASGAFNFLAAVKGPLVITDAYLRNLSVQRR